MRISLQFHSDSDICLSFQYNAAVQGLIYKLLPEERSEFLHNKGFLYEKRRFKLFTFSRILGKLTKNPGKDGLIFEPPIELQVASAIDWILQEVAEKLLRIGEVQLEKNRITLQAIQVNTPQRFEKKVKMKMLSPMTVYSTLTKPDGKKITHYYTPFDNDFSSYIQQNILKKYKALYGDHLDGELSVTPLFKGNRERIIKFKGIVIKAWDGIYELTGNPELILLAYDTGLGSKNSQGFGMWEVVR